MSRSSGVNFRYNLQQLVGRLIAADSSRVLHVAYKLHLLAYRRRRLVALSTYAAMTALAYGCAYLLRFEFRVVSGILRTFALTLPLLLVIRVVCDHSANLSTARWRYAGTSDLLRLVGSSTFGSVLFWLATRSLGAEFLAPRSVIVLEWGIRIYLIAAIWITYRVSFEALRRHQIWRGRALKRVLLVGAGEAGNMLVREMIRSPTGYRPVGFVDDDPAKWGSQSHGIEVIGHSDDLVAIARDVGADEIIIAVPSATATQLRKIVELCEATNLGFKVLPGIREVIEGGAHLNQLREVQLEDLLGREPIHLQLPELIADLEGRCVLVTGAAGSIGGELVRQVALHRPRTLILLDQAETDLYYLDLDLRNRFPELEPICVLADVTNADSVNAVFREYAPERVFHAAAYKHVPMVEHNPAEAFRNNVFGTLRVAAAAGKYGSGTFVLVSTDKAVEPVSVMGATKRLAEMLIVELQREYNGTSYIGVRFGNVLGSNGSVIPLFQKQILAGLPLTVTHPDITRYFMTIPEAVQLILQASILPNLRGHIAMLDMGEPVRILDLATNLLRATGRSGRNGEAIQFIGLRPGEKLHEDLVAPDEDAVPTAHPKVRLIRSRCGPSPTLLPRIAHCDREMTRGSASETFAMLTELFPGLQLNGLLADVTAERRPIPKSVSVAGQQSLLVSER